VFINSTFYLIYLPLNLSIELSATFYFRVLVRMQIIFEMVERIELFIVINGHQDSIEYTVDIHTNNLPSTFICIL